jgi:hypothetical protein
MPTEPKRPWEDRMKEAGKRAEEELGRVLRFIDDEVVPEVRRSGSSALRAAAEQLQKLAQNLDESRDGDAPKAADDATEAK